MDLSYGHKSTLLFRNGSRSQRLKLRRLALRELVGIGQVIGLMAESVMAVKLPVR